MNRGFRLMPRMADPVKTRFQTCPDNLMHKLNRFARFPVFARDMDDETSR